MADTDLSPEEQQRQLRLMYDWMPAGSLDVYSKEWFKSGSSDAAWAAVQHDPRYEEWFPGNLTDDGRPRYPEKDYAKTVAAYDEVFTNVGLNPELFRSRYGELIAGEVSPYELETNRINPMHDRIVSQSEQLRGWYAENYGIALTDAALVASAIDPKLGERILTKQIDMAEIGGEALEAGYDIDFDLVQRIVEETEVTKGEAEQSFLQAKSIIPTMNVLAARHADPNDEFDLETFIQADLFKDPKEIRRMNRLLAQERSTFSSSSADYRRDKTGNVAGLGIS